MGEDISVDEVSAFIKAMATVMMGFSLERLGKTRFMISLVMKEVGCTDAEAYGVLSALAIAYGRKCSYGSSEMAVYSLGVAQTLEEMSMTITGRLEIGIGGNVELVIPGIAPK